MTSGLLRTGMVPSLLGEAHPGSSFMVIIKCQLYGLPTKRLVGKPQEAVL